MRTVTFESLLGDLCRRMNGSEGTVEFRSLVEVFGKHRRNERQPVVR